MKYPVADAPKMTVEQICGNGLKIGSIALIVMKRAGAFAFRPFRYHFGAFRLRAQTNAVQRGIVSRRLILIKHIQRIHIGKPAVSGFREIFLLPQTFQRIHVILQRQIRKKKFIKRLMEKLKLRLVFISVFRAFGLMDKEETAEKQMRMV